MDPVPILTLGIVAANYFVNVDILSATYKVLAYHQEAYQRQITTAQYQNSVLYLLHNISNKIGGDKIMETLDYSKDIKKLEESLQAELSSDYTERDLAALADKITVLDYLKKCHGKHAVSVEATGHIY